MGHHFDSPESRADSRINITDNYLFAGDRVGTVVAVLALSPLAGLPSPYHDGLQATSFRPDTAYELCFDVDGDARADVVFRWVFQDGDGGPQHWALSYRADAQGGGPWRELGAGTTGSTVDVDGVGRVTAGVFGDPFWLDAVAAQQFIAKVDGGRPGDGPDARFTADGFSTGTPTTGATNVIAVVAELPLRMISTDPFGFHTSVRVFEHGEWLQVNRCGRPNFAATFVDNPERSRHYNDTDPVSDVDEFTPDIVRVVAPLVRAAGTHPDPDAYAHLAARALLPDLIPYDPALPTSFGFAGINGRGLRDDFGAVVYSTVFNFPMRTGLAPFADLRDGWPYLPEARPLPAADAAAVPSRQDA